MAYLGALSMDWWMVDNMVDRMLTTHLFWIEWACISSILFDVTLFVNRIVFEKIGDAAASGSAVNFLVDDAATEVVVNHLVDKKEGAAANNFLSDAQSTFDVATQPLDYPDTTNKQNLHSLQNKL